MLTRLLDDPIIARVLVVAPHPDDEVIGAGIALGRMRDVDVLHLTDGAPHERRFWTAACATRAAYAELRRAEALAALELAGIAPERVHALNRPDQSLSDSLVDLTRSLMRFIAARRPALVITTPYEGAHPDHDAAAFACRAALAMLPQQDPAPRLIEMTSYHLHAGELRSGRFLSEDRDNLCMVSTYAERERKAAMLAAHVSQQAMLGHFPVHEEQFRAAPACDFTAPPHPGPLFYETIGMPIAPAAWRARARAAVTTLHDDGHACAS